MTADDGETMPIARTMTEDQARTHLERHLRAAMAQVTAGLDAEAERAETMPCDDPSDGGPPGRVFVEAHYLLRGREPSENQEVFDGLHRYWTTQGYTVLRDQRDRPPAPLLTVRHTDDGFSVGLRENVIGELRVFGSSPCVWPDGLPPAAADGNGAGPRR
jgi:hypothetical protein